MMKKAIARAASGQSLSVAEMMSLMNLIMEGGASAPQISAWLVALRMKGESLEEISGAAKVMRDKALPVPTALSRRGAPLLDIVGTGGDGTNTFNVSTVSAFVAAAAGVPVAKHGNRAVSSSCGAADLIEALGAELDLGPSEVGWLVDTVGFGFLFAPTLHLATRHAVLPRQEIGLRTIFNLLGPLTNPARPNRMLLGVFDPEICRPYAEVLKGLGVETAYVVHGHGGCDEISISGPSSITRLENGEIDQVFIHPGDFGLQTAPLDAVSGGTPRQAREHCLAVLSGAPGPRRDMVLLNAGAALAAGGAAQGMAAGIELAARTIDSGAALGKMKQFVEQSRMLKERQSRIMVAG